MKIHFRNHTPVIVAPRFMKFMDRFFGFRVGAVAIFPFIVVQDYTILHNKDYINHESIHIRQYIETLIIGLWIISALQYVYARLFLRKSSLHSYYYMSMEQEAHQNDTNHEYLKTRKWFAYYKYLNPKYRKRMDLVDGKRVIYD